MDKPWISIDERSPDSSMSFVRVLKGKDREHGVAHYNALYNLWLTAEQGEAYKFIIPDITHWKTPVRKLWY